MNTKEMKRWAERLKTTPPMATHQLSKPIAVFFLEADNHLKFVSTYWEPAPDGSRPGLASAASLLDLSVVDELESLLVLARDADIEALYVESTAGQRVELMKRGKTLLFELGAACALVLDDTTGPTIAERAADFRSASHWNEAEIGRGQARRKTEKEALVAAAARAATDQSAATFLQALLDTVTIAESLEAQLTALPGFERAWLAETRQVAESLGDLGAPTLSRKRSPLLDVRNRAMTLIKERCQRIHKVASYVFRHHPDLLRPLQSAHTRRRNLTARRPKPDPSAQDPS